MRGSPHVSPSRYSSPPPTKQGRMFHVDLGQNKGPFLSRELRANGKMPGRGGSKSRTGTMFPPIHNKMPTTDSHVNFIQDKRSEEACNSVNTHIKEIEGLI